MIKKCKIAIATIIVSGITAGMMYLAADVSQRSQFYQGLKFKVEDVAQGTDGVLDLEEMISVCEVLNIDPAKRLHDRGFSFSGEEMQRYLKAKGNFDSKTDIYRFRTEGQPNFKKAKAEGKKVYNIQF